MQNQFPKLLPSTAAAGNDDQMTRHHDAVRSRDRARRHAIEQALAATMSRKVQIECRAGQLPFVEIAISNLSGKGGEKERFQIQCESVADGNHVLDVVTDAGEWSVLKASHGLATPISAAIVNATRVWRSKSTLKTSVDVAPSQEADLAPLDNDPIIYTIEVLPGETVYVPLRWHSNSSNQKSSMGLSPVPSELLLSGRPAPTGACSAISCGLKHAVDPVRTIVNPSDLSALRVPGGNLIVNRVGLRAGPIARVELQLCPRPITLNHTVHFVGGKGGILHGTVPVTPATVPLLDDDNSMALGVVPGKWRTEMVYCSNGSTDSIVQAGLLDARVDVDSIQLRVRCPTSSTEPIASYFILYDATDKYWRPRAIWQVLCTGAGIVSIPSAVAGQSSYFSLPLAFQNADLTDLVLHTSHPGLLVLQHGTRITDDPGSDCTSAQAQIIARPLSEGQQCWAFSAVQSNTTVEAESYGAHSLVECWLVQVAATIPEVSRTCSVHIHRQNDTAIAPFEVDVANPYRENRRFTVHCNLPGLVLCEGAQSHKSLPHLDAEEVVPGRCSLSMSSESRMAVKLQYLPRSWLPKTQTTHVKLFINDEHDKIEELMVLQITEICSPDELDFGYTASYASASKNTRNLENGDALKATTSAGEGIHANFVPVEGNVEREEQQDAALQLLIDLIAQAQITEIPALEAALTKRKLHLLSECNAQSSSSAGPRKDVCGTSD